MASESQINEIKSLAVQGDSVNSIKERLDLPKSTVYYHFRKEAGQKQKENSLQIPKDEEVIGELCRIFAGDGNFYPSNKIRPRPKKKSIKAFYNI
ncbi:hypothetical protein GKQ38_04835 [Candidatus Nanohaloarchaea archaeon]|nr:hypothetical protein GKQ38_04835 [Candidatus Nanohaloarchaea archaeon]